VRKMTGDEIRIRKDLGDLLLVEYSYWREIENDEIDNFAMGAMGGVSNVLGALLAGLTVDEFRASKTTGLIIPSANADEQKDVEPAPTCMEDLRRLELRKSREAQTNPPASEPVNESAAQQQKTEGPS
jgi:hypothetical protein